MAFKSQAAEMVRASNASTPGLVEMMAVAGQRRLVGFWPWKSVVFYKETAVMIAVSCNPSRLMPVHCHCMSVSWVLFRDD